MKKSFKKSLSIFMSVLLICSMAFSLHISPVVAEEADSTDEISFYENVSEAEFSEDDTITVLIEFDYPENDYDVRETDSLESSQEQLRLLRASNRAYYTENNQDFIDDLDIEYDGMDVSAYSPYVFVTFETWDEYADARDDLIELSENDKVKRVFAEETPVTEDEAVTVNNSESSATMTLNDAKKMIGVKDENGVNTTNYTGEGIRVGIIEPGNPSNFDNFTVEQIKGILSPIQSDYDYSDEEKELCIIHAECVATIIGGTCGIAPNVDFYFAGMFSQYAVEWLIDNQVNIINVSSGYGDSGYYVGYDLYTDYISRSNLVLFINSAGNHFSDTPNINPNKMITNPGLGFNVLTVGSVDAGKNISYFSCFATRTNYLNKPTFVAPGERIVIPNTEGDISGTSFSAPMVTGIVALLLEEFDFLLDYPDLIPSALINGCELLPGQTDIWESFAGVGLVNYVNTRNILLESRYDTATVVENENNDTALLEVSTFLATNESVTFCLFDFSRQILSSEVIDIFETESFGTQYTPSITQYVIKVYNSSGVLSNPINSQNNIIAGEFENTYEDGMFYIRVYMLGTKQSGSSEYLSLTYSTTHEHSYTHSYTNPTRLGHTCHCACGEAEIEPHVFQEIFGEARTCAKCGYSE